MSDEQMEPDSDNGTQNEQTVRRSIAISLKRIADALDVLVRNQTTSPTPVYQSTSLSADDLHALKQRRE